MPKTPEEWLAVSKPPEKSKGILKLFLGYAPGVGKTYSMLSEAIRRKNRGEDLAIGVVAVSYTHLDVYKRQVMARTVGAMLSIC